jgi:Peptidase family M50
VAHDLAVTAGGPLASFLLTAIFCLAALLTRALPGLQTWLIYTGLLSAALSTLNLLPLPGLDGGHLFLLSLAQMGLQLPPENGGKGTSRRAARHGDSLPGGVGRYAGRAAVGQGLIRLPRCDWLSPFY